MHFTYLDFPVIPKDLESKILEIVDSHSHTNSNRSGLNIEASDAVVSAIENTSYDSQDSLGLPIEESWKDFDNVAKFDFLDAPSEVTDWVVNNIDKDVGYVSIQVMHGGSIITPHIDEVRSYAYNYILTANDGITGFYKPSNEYRNYKAYAKTYFPYDRLTLIEEIKIDALRWHRLSTQTIHGVTNLDPNLKRISLSLSFL